MRTQPSGVCNGDAHPTRTLCLWFSVASGPERVGPDCWQRGMDEEITRRKSPESGFRVRKAAGSIFPYIGVGEWRSLPLPSFAMVERPSWTEFLTSKGACKWHPLWVFKRREFLTSTEACKYIHLKPQVDAFVCSLWRPDILCTCKLHVDVFACFSGGQKLSPIAVSTTANGVGKKQPRAKLQCKGRLNRSFFVPDKSKEQQ